MYGLKLVDGDFSLRDDGRVNLVSGAERVAQDLSCWLLEPVGTDMVYPAFGSVLWDMIGEPATDSAYDNLLGEIGRVCANYVQYQEERRQDDEHNMSVVDYSQTWPDSDIIVRYDASNADMFTDTANVNIGVTMADGRSTVVNENM